MSLTKPLIFDGGFERAINQGDIPGGAEINNNLTTAGAGALTGTLLAGSILYRTGPTGAVADTTDTAANIIAAVAVNNQNPMPGSTHRLRIINTVAFVETLAAGTGVTLAGVTANAASSFRDYLISLTNTTPTSIASAATTNTSAVITGMDSSETIQVSPGMLVTGTGIPAATTVISVQPGIGVTLSANATATSSLVALTFSPTVTITGIGSGLI